MWVKIVIQIIWPEIILQSIKSSCLIFISSHLYHVISFWVTGKKLAHLYLMSICYTQYYLRCFKETQDLISNKQQCKGKTADCREVGGQREKKMDTRHANKLITIRYQSTTLTGVHTYCPCFAEGHFTLVALCVWVLSQCCAVSVWDFQGTHLLPPINTQ